MLLAALLAPAQPLLAQRVSPPPPARHSFAMLAHAADSLRIRDTARREVEHALERAAPDLMATAVPWRVLSDLLNSSAYPPCYCEFLPRSDARQLARYRRAHLMVEVLVERDTVAFNITARVTHADTAHALVQMTVRARRLSDVAAELAEPLTQALRAELALASRVDPRTPEWR